jgi:predicted acetyltransferase
MFEFRDPGHLIDGDLELVLLEQYPGDPLANRVPAFKFGMRLRGELPDIGNVELRVGNTTHLVMYAGHLGYVVNAAQRGHGYAARACRLLLPLALSHGLKTLWITCSPDNVASQRTCERLGAEYVETVDLPEDTDMYQRGRRQVCRYWLEIVP